MTNLGTRERESRHGLVELADGQGTRSRRRGLRTFIVAAVLVVVAAGGTSVVLAVTRSSDMPRAAVAVQVVGNHTEITLTDGRSSISQVAASLAAQKKRGLVTSVSGGGWELHATLVVGSRALLTVHGTPLLMLSDNTTVARVIVQGGEARFERTTVSSWTNARQVDADLSDGRADIVAQGVGSSLFFLHARVVGLGADTNDPGVSIRQGARGSVVDSQFEHCFRGLYAYKSGALLVQHSTFTDNAENGVLFLAPAVRARITSSRFSHNGANGVEVDDARNAVLASVTANGNKYSGISAHSDAGLLITGSVSYQNTTYGLALTSSTRTTATGFRTFSNVVGLQVNGGTTAVERSFISANSSDGLFTTGPSTVLTANLDRFDHNGGGGLSIANGRVTARSNVFDANRSGVLVKYATPAVTLVANTITNSSLDGIGLLSVPGTDGISNNTISGSAKAAFSTRLKADVAGLLARNHIKAGEPRYRVRGN